MFEQLKTYIHDYMRDGSVAVRNAYNVSSFDDNHLLIYSCHLFNNQILPKHKGFVYNIMSSYIQLSTLKVDICYISNVSLLQTTMPTFQ